VADLASLELEPRKLDVYGSPIGLRLLWQDPRTGAEHYLVRYPAGLEASWHRHSAAHTIYVIEGRLHANDRVLEPGTYRHFPAGEPMWHAPAEGTSCLFPIMFAGPFDVEVVDKPA
jgi:quercetin dioxygenase-like cupin family protein